MSRHSNRRAPRCGSSSTSRSAWTNWKPFASLLWTAFIATGRQSVWKSPGKHPGGSRKRHAGKWRGQSLKDRHSLTTEVSSLWKALEHFIVPHVDTPGTLRSETDDRTSVPSVTVTASGAWEPGVVPGNIPDEVKDLADKGAHDFARASRPLAKANLVPKLTVCEGDARPANTIHRGCLICGSENRSGLHVHFHRQGSSVVASHICDHRYDGYFGVLHGGVIAALLDGAMTNCLFAHHITAVTAEMTVRYLLPVRTGEHVQLRAWIEKADPRLYSLRAELRQNHQVACYAAAKFIPKPATESEPAEHENCHSHR